MNEILRFTISKSRKKLSKDWMPMWKVVVHIDMTCKSFSWKNCGENNVHVYAKIEHYCTPLKYLLMSLVVLQPPSFITPLPDSSQFISRSPPINIWFGSQAPPLSTTSEYPSQCINSKESGIKMIFLQALTKTWTKQDNETQTIQKTLICQDSFDDSEVIKIIKNTFVLVWVYLVKYRIVS